MATPSQPAWALAPNQSQQPPPQQQQQQYHQQAMTGGVTGQQSSQAYYQQQYNQRPSTAVDPPPSSINMTSGHPQNSQYNYNNNNSNFQDHNNNNNIVRPTVSSIPAKPTYISNRAATTSKVLNREEGIVVSTPDEEYEDGRVKNEEAKKKIRDMWILAQIAARSAEFTQHKNLRIFIGTWNVNAKYPTERLDDWLCSSWHPDGSNAPDVVAIGLQEMVDLNAVNVAVEGKSAQKSQQWIERILFTLNSRFTHINDPRRYVNVKSKYLVGLMLCVFVKNSHSNRVKCVHSDSVGVGVMGMMGNKGGVSVRLQFYDSTLCFINAHLAAHRENVTGRNADFHNVYNKLQYDIGQEAATESINNGNLDRYGNTNQVIGVADHDIVFWLGDLNYRIHESFTTEQVLDLAERVELEVLRKYDQLNIERGYNRVFQGFQEGELNFMPTYKYQPGTDMFDKRPDKKLRAPAWCDRVLWMVQDENHLKQIDYKRSELNMSDHKPVMSTFLATIKDVIPNDREKVYYSVHKRLDQYENKSLPMIGLDRTELDFGEVRFGKTITKTIKIKNTGNVVAQFRLVPKLDETKYCKPWLSVLPTYGLLIPGENETQLNFTIQVNNEIASALNSGKDVLEDVLILRLENGRDYYISVRGNYGRSCFGMPLDELVLYNDPIRSVPLDPVKRVEKYGVDQTAVLCVPKELWRIVDAIYEKGLHEPDLFNISGYSEEVQRIRECLDTGEAFGDFRIHSMVDILISFLSSLSSTVVPKNVLPTLDANIDSNNMQYYARQFLEGLPPIHYNVFVYIISFFRECLLFQQSNQLSSHKLAIICVRCLVIGNQTYNENKQVTQRQNGMHILMIDFLESSLI